MFEEELFVRTREYVLEQYTISPPVMIQNGKKHEVLSPAAARVLRGLYDYPFLKLVARAELLGMSVTMTDRLLSGLRNKDFITPWRFSRPKQGYVQYFDITKQGIQAGGLSMPDKGGGGVLHRLCQARICKLFASRHCAAHIEYTQNGKRVDIAVREQERLIALEVGISSADNEYSNIIKDFAAGFTEVRALIREANMKEHIEKRMLQERYEPTGTLKIERLAEYLEQPLDIEGVG